MSFCKYSNIAGLIVVLGMIGLTANAEGLWHKVKRRIPDVPTIEDPTERIRKELESTKKEVDRIINNLRNLDPPGASEQLWGEAGRAAYPAAAATMATRSPRGDALQGELKSELRKHFGDLVSQVRIHWGVEPLDQWAAARFKIEFPGGAKDTQAQTFGYNIYVKHDKDAKDEEFFFGLLAHELVHVRQFKKWGNSYSDFGYHYFKEFKRANQVYKNNKLEKEAYDVEAEITPLWHTGPHLRASRPDIDGPETDGNPSEAAIAVDGDWIYWVTSKGRFRRGKLNPAGRLKAHGPDIDGPEQDGSPSQVAIAVDGEWIYWVTSDGRFRRGKLNSAGRLKAHGPDIDGPEKDGSPSQVAIAVDGDWIYWVTSDGRFRRGKLKSDGTLKGAGPDVDGRESNGRPSQIVIAVEDDQIFWVTDDGRFRRGKIE